MNAPFIIEEEEGENRVENEDDDDADQNNSGDEAHAGKAVAVKSVAIVETTERNDSIVR